jgi:NPCBM/NEW2 domain/Putative binding domain, N-terminal/Secretion system C-terminal sorting domain
MKKIFKFFFMLSLLSGIEQNVIGQTWQPCTTASASSTPNYNGNLVTSRPNYFYFGQVWNGEMLMNNSDTNFNPLFGGSTVVNYSLRHYDNSNFTQKFDDLKTSLSNNSGLTAFDPINGTNNSSSFWNVRMSASNGMGGLMGENLLIGFARTNSGGTRECLYVTKKWKELPANFTNGNDVIISDRNLIYSNTQNKAHVILNTQNTGCSVTPVVSFSESPTPPSVRPQPGNPGKVNHFFYNGFASGATVVTLQYTNCDGTAANGPGSPKTTTITRSSATVSSVVASPTFDPCINGIRKVTLNLSGGTGVYEMNIPNEKTKIYDGAIIDKYTFVDDLNIFGRNYLQLSAGTTQTIKVRDARIYDVITGAGDPVPQQDYMNTLLPAVANNYYPITINVPACNVATLTATNPTLFGSNASNQNITVTASNLSPNSWSASNNGNTWITVSPSSGVSGATPMTISVSANTSATQRNGSITISGGGATPVTISVTQSGVASCSTYVSDLTATSVTQGYGTLQKDKSVDGNPLRIGSSTYAKGLGTHAISNIKYNLVGGNYTSFQSVVGRDIDANGCNCGTQKLRFKVKADGVQLFDSGDMTLNQTQNVNVDVTGKQQLELIVEDSGDQYYGDHADWADAKLSCNSTIPTCNFTLANNTQSGTTGTNLTLNPNCTGTDCGSVSYSWTCSNGTSGNGLNVTLPTTAANYTYTVTGTKSGCTSKTSTITATATGGGCLTVTAPGYNCGNKILEAITVSGGGGTYVYNIDGCENSIAKNIMGYTGDAAKYVDYPFWWQQLTLGNHTIYVRDKNNASCTGSVSLNITCANTSTPTTLCAGARIGAAEENKSEEQEGVFIAPNPVNNVLHYSYISDIEADEIQIQIFDMTGKSLTNVRKQKTGRVTKGEISVENFMQGSYILNATDGVKKDAKRFIKE